MKPKLYIYEDALKDKYPVQGFERWPFANQADVDAHFDVTTDPDAADWFWCGRYHNGVAFLLHQNRFEHYKGRERRHIIDLEGDFWRVPWPEWMKPATLIVMNAYSRVERIKDGWRFMARPPCSKLLMKLVDDGAPEWTPPKHKKLFFHGQPEAQGLRQRMIDACEGLPADIRINRFWGAVLETEHDVTASYIQGMLDNAFCLCPGGAGHHTSRLYEACAFGRVPVVIADSPVFAEDEELLHFMYQVSHMATKEQMHSQFERILRHETTSDSRDARQYFVNVVRTFFQDPTGYFLKWTERHP